MQRLNYRDLQEGTPGTVHVCGNFTTAGASQISVQSTGPFTASRTGVGTIVITFKENFNELLSGDCQVLDVTGGTKAAFIIPASTTLGGQTTPATITIETQSVAGTKADLASSVISFDINWRKGALKK